MAKTIQGKGVKQLSIDIKKLKKTSESALHAIKESKEKDERAAIEYAERAAREYAIKEAQKKAQLNTEKNRLIKDCKPCEIAKRLINKLTIEADKNAKRGIFNAHVQETLYVGSCIYEMISGYNPSKRYDLSGKVKCPKLFKGNYFYQSGNSGYSADYNDCSYKYSSISILEYLVIREINDKNIKLSIYYNQGKESIYSTLPWRMEYCSTAFIIAAAKVSWE